MTDVFYLAIYQLRLHWFDPVTMASEPEDRAIRGFKWAQRSSKTKTTYLFAPLEKMASNIFVFYVHQSLFCNNHRYLFFFCKAVYLQLPTASMKTKPKSDGQTRQIMTSVYRHLVHGNVDRIVRYSIDFSPSAAFVNMQRRSARRDAAKIQVAAPRSHVPRCVVCGPVKLHLRHFINL